MKTSRTLKWIVGLVLGPLLLAVLFIAVFGWNWMRGPIERLTIQKTGRALAINGDLTLKLAWPFPHVRAQSVTFANPAWAKEKQMLSASAIDVTVSLKQLLQRQLTFPEVRLDQPVVFLEQSLDGRKSWLLDIDQRDEEARIHIDRLALNQGTLGFEDPARKTSIRSQLSTQTQQGKESQDAAVAFEAQGQYKGLALKASGTGGPVLALRYEDTPYDLKVVATVGKTSLEADGQVTSLLKFSAVDMNLKLRGDSLAQLFPLLGIAAPVTRAYTTAGHLVHSANIWRYDNFSGRFGASDIAGVLQVETGGKRTSLTADLVSKQLDFEDLGPLIGAKPGSVDAARLMAVPSPAIDQNKNGGAGTPLKARVLPNVPFQTDRWGSMDADVKLNAKSIRRARELPLENLQAHLTLRDSVLTLDPIDFAMAGGHLSAVISLDGRKQPIQAHARVKARKIQLSKLLPTVDLNKTSIGQINGDFDLTGSGNSVRQMLASANGKMAMLVEGGQISRLMMEKAGLHLWEILELSLSGDRPIILRCAVAEFDVQKGKMRADALVFDTQVTTLLGVGSIDLAQESLDLTFNQKTKRTSPLALRSPIYIRGSFVKPEVGVDKGRVAVRALGAVALGLVNPLLALIPLVDPGPGKDSDCGQLVLGAKQGRPN